MTFLIVLCPPIIYHILVLYKCRSTWKKYRAVHPQGRFNYRITDIWAAMGGVAPVLALFASAAKHSGIVEIIGSMLVVAFVLLSQAEWIFIGRLDIEYRPEFHRSPTAWDSAVSIFCGSLLGIVAPIGFFIALSMILTLIIGLLR